ncbi:hypothetical protein ABH902_002431 [Enterococcus sp. UD-01]
MNKLLVFEKINSYIAMLTKIIYKKAKSQRRSD